MLGYLIWKFWYCQVGFPILSNKFLNFEAFCSLFWILFTWILIVILFFVVLQYEIQFLDGSLIKELSLYLEVLHAKGKASSHHSTILINCYIRMSNKEKIEKFIDQNFSCDVDVVVHVGFILTHFFLIL